MAETNRAALAAQMSQAEARIAQAEMNLRKMERKLQQAQAGYTSGAIGIVLGVVLLIFVNSWVGIFFLICGFLAGITGMIQRGIRRRALNQIEQMLASDRAQVASLRAQLLV